METTTTPSGYIFATALCQSAGVKWNEYWVRRDTRLAANAIAEKHGLAVSEVVRIKKGGIRSRLHMDSP